MLLQLLRFELRYQSKQWVLPIAALIFFTLGYVLGNAGNAPALVDFNSPFQISYYSGNLSLMSVFIIMLFVVNGTIRDDKYQMEALIFSTAVRKHHFFWSRFLGIFFFSVIGFSAFLPGFLTGISLSDLDAARIASFQVQSYLWPFFVIIVPNVFIFTTLLFSVSLLSKSNVAVYASAILLYILYFIVGIYSNSPMFASSLPASAEQMAKAAVLDPFAISTFFEHTQFWTPFEKSSLTLSFSGSYFWNRVLWIGFSFLVLGITYRLFSFRKIVYRKRKKLKESDQETAIQSYQVTSIQVNREIQWRAFWFSIKIDVKEILSSLPFIAIVLTLLIASAFELYIRFYEGGFYSENWYPYTNLVIETLIEIIPFLNKILIVFYSGELMWKAKDQKFDSILNASPTRNWVFFLSKLSVLALLPMLLIVTVLIVGLIFQWSNGFTDIDFGQYLFLFYQFGIPALVFSMLAIFVQVISKSKYLGMGITGLLILCLTTPLSYNLGIEHPMLRIGTMPSILYSNMAGYSIQFKSFAIYTWYWLAFGFILSLLSLKFWNRQLIEPVRLRKREGVTNWRLGELVGLSLSVLLFIAAGSIFYKKLHTEGCYKSTEDKKDHREQYERKFKQYEDLPKLYYADMKTEVAIYPKEEKYTISADYQLINRSTTPVKRLFITEIKALSNISFEEARLIFKDTTFGVYLFEFNTPILPDQTTRLRYELTHQSLPFKPDYTIIKNGTYIRHQGFEPVFGYRKSLELTDAQERKKRNLPEQKRTLLNKKDLFNAKSGNGDVSFETIVSTSEDQMALAPGNLVKKWTEGGRNYYQYKFPEKAIPVIAYLSANYALKTQSCNGMDVDYYYHPGHAINHQIIEESACATLSYCTENFGEYPFDCLKIAETPSYFPFRGAAQAGLINMVEDNLYLIDIRKNRTFELVAKWTAKEVAHQWWGGVLSPKAVPGGGFLTEGLANYTAALTLKKSYGIGAFWELSKNFNERYFRGRTFASSKEPPLYLEHGEKYLIGGKGSSVLLAISDLVGEEKLNVVLRKLIECYAQTTTYEVHTLHFLEELYKVTPEDYHQLIDEWMKQLIRYELKVEHTKYHQLENGKYKLTATISAKRFKTLPSGKEVVIGIDEPLKIGVFNQHPRDIEKTEEILFLKDYQIKDTLTEISLTLDTLPQYISIDPFLTRADRNYADNIKAIAQE